MMIVIRLASMVAVQTKRVSVVVDLQHQRIAHQKKVVRLVSTANGQEWLLVEDR